MSKVEAVSTEVAVRVFETKPAVVNFNYQEISDHLDLVLAKYRGLVFTESTVTDCKKTIAELRKGQKSLDEFRKVTKKQLTESVTFFENQCKVLYGKFEEVIQPLSHQQDQFELDRREQKCTEVQTVIDELIIEQGLTEKYASRLVMLEEYFNKGKSIKAIKTELSALANTLRVQQDKDRQDIDLVKAKVALANAQYQLSNVLMTDAYLRLLSFKSVDEIDLLITADAEKMQAIEKKAAEATTETAQAPNTVEATLPEPVKVPGPTPIAVPIAATGASKITAVYEITGTEEQLSALEDYLTFNNLSWIDRPND